MRFTSFITRSPPAAERFVAARFGLRCFARTMLLLLLSHVCILFVINYGTTGIVQAQTLRESSQASRIALLVFGDTRTARATDEHLRRQFSRADIVQLIDFDLAFAAARGAGYAGSLNLTIEEARDIGAAIGCDYLLLADAQTIRRSSTDTPVYYEAYASLFLVEARTGKLISWHRPRQESLREVEATDSLLKEITITASHLIELTKEHRTTTRTLRANAFRDMSDANQINAANDAASYAASVQAEAPEDYREPQPYRRISPAYTEAAYKAEAEATVDAQVDINETGEVVRVEIVRWAGFDLDESVAQAIKAMHFRPAQAGGKAMRARVLLRYNFRRPPRRSADELQDTNLFVAPS